MVRLVLPRAFLSISGARQKMERAMARFSGGIGTAANPKVAMPSVMM